MRRSFKVATVFTGAAALAGGYGPAALAATAQTTAVHPDIAYQECGANDDGISNWVHLYYPADDHPAECFHGSGSEPAGATIASFCPGNNKGEVFGSVDGVTSPFPFAAGDGRHPVSWYDGYAGNYHVTGIYIIGWSGNAKCT